MKLPKLPYQSGRYAVRVQTAFGGLNRSAAAGDGAITDMENLSGREYPLLSVRPKRGVVSSVEDPGGLGCRGDKLYWLSGTSFVYDGTVKGTVASGSHRMVSMGKTVLILPDMQYYDVEQDVFGSLAAQWSGSGVVLAAGAEECSVNCPNAGWNSLFREGDALTITGCAGNAANNVTHAIVRSVASEALCFDAGVLTLPAGAETSYTESGSITITREVPQKAAAMLTIRSGIGCFRQRRTCPFPTTRTATRFGRAM